MSRREWHPCPRCGSANIKPSEIKPTVLVCTDCGWDVDTPDTSRWADHEFEDLIEQVEEGGTEHGG